MIPAGVQIFVALDPIDMRFGFERLIGLARERTGYDSRSGAMFVFMGRRKHTLKILFFDGTGMCVFHKRLDRNVFSLPDRLSPNATHVEIDETALSALLDGLPIAPGDPTRRTIH